MLRLVAGLCLALAFAQQAHAETYRLNYEAAVLNVVVLGNVNFEVTASPTRYAVRAGVRTSGMARMFDQTQITATSTGSISNAGISWARYDLSHAYASKFRRIRMNRGAGGISAEINPDYRDIGDRAASAAQQRSSYDPLTALFALGRQVGAARACRGSVLVFDGRQHYRLSVTPRGQGNFRGGGYTGPALNCNFRYQPIAGYSERSSNANIPTAEAWFALPAQSGFAAPLRFTVPTPVGAAQLDLRSYEAR